MPLALATAEPFSGPPTIVSEDGTKVESRSVSFASTLTVTGVLMLVPATSFAAMGGLGTKVTLIVTRPGLEVTWLVSVIVYWNVSVPEQLNAGV